MRSAERSAVQEELVALPGVGRKVADCVALFALDQCEAVPVDTHVWDIVVRDYNSFIPPMGKLGGKASNQSDSSNSVLSSPQREKPSSLTPTIYNGIGDAFRAKFGMKSGWAHSILFTGELPMFRSLLPTEVQEEMILFSREKSMAKKEQKEYKKQKTKIM